MTSTTGVGRIAAALVGIAAAACSVTPVDGPTPTAHDEVSPVTGRRSAVSDFERHLRDRALSQTRQGRLADAALSWEILTVLRPNAEEYHDRLGATRDLIEAAVPDRLHRGAQALKRGELDAATAHYLAVLALQPAHEQAAQALRGIERERNKHSFLGKSSRLTLVRRAAADAKMAARAQAPAVPLDRNELEHAAMLATQDEFDDAIALVERHLAADHRDTAACRLLADLYYQKADRQLAGDKQAAIGVLEKSVRLDASHVRAVAKLKQLKKTGAFTPISTVASKNIGCASTP